MATPQELIDLFDLDFGKKAQARIKAATPKPAPAKKPAPFTDKTREAYLATSPHWHPVALVHHIHLQTCRCCGGATEILGSTLVRHTNRLQATWECPRTDIPGDLTLPPEYITHHFEVEKCPSCLRADSYLSSWPPAQPVQYSLLAH